MKLLSLTATIGRRQRAVVAGVSLSLSFCDDANDSALLQCYLLAANRGAVAGSTGASATATSRHVFRYLPQLYYRERRIQVPGG